MFDKMSGVVLLFLCELFPSFVFQDIQDKYVEIAC